ncbi:MAG TPA: prolyl oligopeptidase family serine peptidase [Blastocatellia bacterium]|nr:prolyl oligopeptidase family serine peptidase [Blastocatellia bacterium]
MKFFAVRSLAALTLALSFAVIPTMAQDAATTLRLSIGFRTLMNSERMSDEIRKLVEELEEKARKATTGQKYGEAIKYYMRAMALIRNQPWTPSRALGAAMQVKIERAVFDPGDKARITISQLFALDEPIADKLSGSISLKDSKQEHELKKLSDLEPDFTKPFSIEAAIPNLADGNYQLTLTLKSKEGDPIIKPAPILIARGLSIQADALKTRAASVAAKLKADNKPDLLLAIPSVEFAASMIEMVNSGQLSLERADIKSVIVKAAATLDQINRGEHPLRAIRGDVYWAYRSAVDETVQPYRFYIPKSYDAKQKWPMVVALHGMGGDENSFFTGYDNGAIRRIADERGYIVVCPKGRGPVSMYLGSAERDVIDVIKEMKRDFSIDDDRVYLMGHSMGGYGTWSVAVNNPDLFAAIGPISGGGTPLSRPRLKAISRVPWIVVHGDNDPTVPVDESRKMVKAGKELGIEIKYIEVSGGNHSNVVASSFKDIFDWFDAHKRQPTGAAKAATATSNQ